MVHWCSCNFVTSTKIDFKKCRGIKFDNAVRMSSVHVGVQRLLRKINGRAKFVPCSNHSLNLCVVHALAGNTSAITFFGVIERLCTLFCGAYGVMVIVVGNEHGNTSSNPGRD